MESVASNSVPSDQPRHRPTPRPRSPHPITDRIVRAIRHNLLLLHRYDSSFFVLGATANVYTVTLSSTPSCTCPDRLAPCKHILFVLLRVLGVSMDDPCIRRQTLRPCQLDRLLSTPSLPGSMAGLSLRQMFHRHFYQSKSGPTVRPVIHIEEGTVCPICLEEMGTGVSSDQRVVSCGTCRNPIHEECLLKWKRSRGRRPGICAICRARWRGRADQEKYVNLGAYVKEDDRVDDDANSHCNE